MKKTVACLLIPAALLVVAGCQETTASNPHKTGTYAGARRSHVGSNIPQRDSADSTNSTYDPDQFQNFQGQRTTAGMGGPLGGGGGR